MIVEEADKASAHRTSSDHVRFSRSNGQNRCMAATTLPSRDWNGTLRRTLRYTYLFSILKIQWLLQNQRLAMRAT